MCMSTQQKQYRLQLGDKELVFSMGLLAQQCNASATLQCGESMAFCTTTLSRDPEDIDYLPLMVNYQEKFYASGDIRGVRFQRREGRPSEKEVLTGRVIDRGLRPMLNKHMRNKIQVMPTIMAYDGQNRVDVLAANAASFTTAMSECPMYYPIGTVRVGMIDGNFVLNPTTDEMEKSDLDLIVTSSTQNVVMIEAGGNQIPDDKMYEAIMFGKQYGQQIAQFIEKVSKEDGKAKLTVEEPQLDAELVSKLESKYASTIEETMFADISKLDRFAKIGDITKEAKEMIEAENEDLVGQVSAVIDKIVKNTVRTQIVQNERRIKGRSLDQIRDLFCTTDIIPRAHGSAVFQRGETQGLTVTTLGGPSDVLYTDGLDGEGSKRYFHHYNFPPFSVGEVSHRLATGNREIGHGNLAEKALIPVLPSYEEFPYTIRTVTEILSSNGSSSMASACGSTLSLMAAGVPIKEPVAGIAMGMMSDESQGIYKILTDLQDEEDFGGDMDFKVTGTKHGITAIQVDIKLKGIPDAIIKQVIDKAKIGRMTIMEVMLAAIPSVRGELSSFAPRLISHRIDPDQIREVIGKGGETINKIIDETGVEINIEDDGLVTITAKDGEAGAKALQIIKNITAKPEVGKIYEGKVVRIEEFGAFVQILPGKDGLVHISMLDDKRVEKTTDVVNMGDMVKVKLIEIDRQGRLRLSMKDAK